LEASHGRRVQGVEIRSSAPGGELMHLKGYLRRSSSPTHRLGYFSRSGETRQDNDLVALRGAPVCAGFDAKFDDLGGSTVWPSIDDPRKFVLPDNQSVPAWSSRTASSRA
jgi:hypothetical protein